MTLRQFEKFHRKFFKASPSSVTSKELIITFCACFFAAPFLFSALFMIPFIGQMLFTGALVLTLIYFYVRKSFKVILTITLANLLFIIPTLLVLKGVSVKNRFEVALFILMATCIPVSIFYSLLAAGRVWYVIESRQGKQSIEGITATGA